MRPLILAFLVLGSIGCASSAAVRTSESLPLRRVVLYRNGVGYFERQGEFEGGALEFTVKRRDVGDFLSSLTAVDRAAGQVRSVSFEMDEEDEKTPTPTKPMPIIMGDGRIVVVPPAPPEAPEEGDEGTEEVDVTLRLEGEDHNLVVSYVVGAPIWRPSYRILLDDEGALLQAWAVVQNTSGEDWRNVQLSLTTGSPIAFRSDLGTPITPERPIVTDQGEVVRSVPQAQTTLQTEEEAANEAHPQQPAATHTYDDDPLSGLDDQEQESAPADRTGETRAAAGPRSTAASTPPITPREIQRSVHAVAAVAQPTEGVTRYDFAQPVTIPTGGSTMVAILNKRVPGESAYLYSPDPGVPDSHAHPFRVARFSNMSGAMLERGPVSVLEQGEFLGQGVLEQLPRSAETFVPFALDRSVVVERDASHDGIPGRLIRIQRGQVWIEEMSAWKTRYLVRNGSERRIKLYVRHDRRSGAELHEAPEGTQRTERAALVPIMVPPHGQERVVVEERTPVERTAQFLSDQAAHAVALYLEGSAVDAAQGPMLRRALEVREDLLTVQQQLRQLEQQRNEAQRAANETRENLKALRKVPGATDLRQRLVQRLSELDRQEAELTRQVVELRTRESELSVRLDEALSEVRLTLQSER